MKRKNKVSDLTLIGKNEVTQSTVANSDRFERIADNSKQKKKKKRMKPKGRRLSMCCSIKPFRKQRISYSM